MKKKYAALLTTDGERINKTPENGTDFSLKELQGFVGGHIEIISLGCALIMVINDEGKLLDLPFNEAATKEYWFYTKNYNDCIVGNALVCESCLVK